MSDIIAAIVLNFSDIFMNVGATLLGLVVYYDMFGRKQ